MLRTLKTIGTALLFTYVAGCTPSIDKKIDDVLFAERIVQDTTITLDNGTLRSYTRDRAYFPDIDILELSLRNGNDSTFIVYEARGGHVVWKDQYVFERKRRSLPYELRAHTRASSASPEDSARIAKASTEYASWKSLLTQPADQLVRVPSDYRSPG